MPIWMLCLNHPSELSAKTTTIVNHLCHPASNSSETAGKSHQNDLFDSEVGRSKPNCDSPSQFVSKLLNPFYVQLTLVNAGNLCNDIGHTM